ncbi:MAG: hypothetical protein ACXWQQ_01295 [Pseudobdellovibrio sp.]
MKKTFLLFILIIGFNLRAAPLCSDLFRTSAYEQRGQEIAAKYPAFKDVLLDPQKYFKQLTERFELQKNIDPEHPYDFDFSDWSTPLFTEMHKLLLEKKASLNKRLALMKSNSLRQWFNKEKIANVELGLEYFNEMQAELEHHIQSGKTSYRETFEIGYFYARMAGLFDVSVLKSVNLRDRILLNLDEYTEGYEKKSVQAELDLYHARQVQLFDRATPISTWQAASKPFEDAIFNKEKLEVIMLPTTEALGEDIFMHLLSTDIHLVAVGVEPIKADGYDRPSGLFFMHDLRHSSFMYYRTMLYKRQYELSREQLDVVSRYMAEQSSELDREIEKLTDRNLAGAIRFYLFNQHHDSGYQYAPSSYLVNNAYHAPFILYTQMLIAGQPRHFNSIFYIPKARKWVEDFWLKRLDAEEALIKSLKAKPTF